MTHDIATLRTERLALRPLRATDTDALVSGAGNYEVARWLGTLPFPYTRADADHFLGSSAAEPRRAWAICEASGPDALLGVVSIDDEMGYWLARSAWGHGYLTEAGRAVIDAAFADPTRRGLWISHMKGNDRSARVIAKLGFRPVGREVRDFRALGQEVETWLYGMTRAEWKAARGLSRRWPWSIGARNASGEAMR